MSLKADQPQVVAFEDTSFQIYDLNGERWVTAREVGRGLGYEAEVRVLQLMKLLRDRGELRERDHFIQTPLPTKGGVQATFLLSRRGVIRVAMRSDAPRAAKFRDWAEDVLYQVMTTGSYQIGQKHWTEELTASERLRLAELRVQIGMKMAEDLKNPVYHGLMAETYGGLNAVKEYADLKGMPDARKWREEKNKQAQTEPRRRVKPPITKLTKDPEVKQLIEKLLREDELTYREIHMKVALEFGEHRAPSETYIGKHYLRMKRAEKPATVVPGNFGKGQ